MSTLDGHVAGGTDLDPLGRPLAMLCAPHAADEGRSISEHVVGIDGAAQTRGGLQ